MPLFGAAGCARAPEPVAAPIQRCVNLANALEAPREGDWGVAITPAHLDAVAAAGFDTVRLPVRWDVHADPEPPYLIDPAFLARVEEVIDLALARDLKVIVDVHHYGALYAGPSDEWQRFLGLWRQIARALKDRPLDALYLELLNEPRGELGGEVWDQLAGEALQTVRAVDPERTVILGGGNWNSIDGLAGMDWPADPHLIATFHFYEPHPFTHQGADFGPPEARPPLGASWGAPADRLTLETRLDKAAHWAAAHQTPLFLGEFGVFKGAEETERARWMSAVRRQAEAREMGWCAFDMAGSFAIWDEETGWSTLMRGALGLVE